MDERNLSQLEAAALLGKVSAQVSHFGGKKPIKPIGDQIASDIELAFDLTHGWLDENHGPSLGEVHVALAGAQRLLEQAIAQEVVANSSFKSKPLRGST